MTFFKDVVSEYWMDMVQLRPCIWIKGHVKSWCPNGMTLKTINQDNIFSYLWSNISAHARNWIVFSIKCSHKSPFNEVGKYFWSTATCRFDTNCGQKPETLQYDMWYGLFDNNYFFHNVQYPSCLSIGSGIHYRCLKHMRTTEDVLTCPVSPCLAFGAACLSRCVSPPCVNTRAVWQHHTAVAPHSIIQDFTWNTSRTCT